MKGLVTFSGASRNYEDVKNDLKEQADAFFDGHPYTIVNWEASAGEFSLYSKTPKDWYWTGEAVAHDDDYPRN